jgi:hypothetical protein
MRKDKQWADEKVMVALCNLYNIVIEVYALVGDGIFETITTIDINNNDKLNVLRLYYENLNHYDHQCQCKKLNVFVIT